jgi:signal transduction histidine kinase
MADITSSLSSRLGALWADNTVLPPLNLNLRRSVIVAILLLVLVGAIQFKELTGSFGPLLFAIYLMSGLCAYGLQFIDDTRRLVVIYIVGMAAVAVLLVARAPVLMLIPLEFNLLFSFYRFPLRRALVLSVVPTIFTLLLAYNVSKESTKANGSTTLLVIFFVYIIVIVAGLARRQNALTNRHLTWTREQLDREMARNANLAVVRERARIARDMHDILAHSLTALSVQLQAARQIAARDPAQTARLLDEMAVTLQQSVAESRQLVQVLHEATAPEAEDSTLAAQLQRIADRFGERTGLRVIFDERGQAHIVSENMAVALRFIVQEALTNAFKHGNARQMVITLEWQDATLSLDMEDDGTPQPAQIAHGDGHGLQGMRERVEALGGTLSAGPRPGQSGFSVCVGVPYERVREKQAV